jgi:hypothetical protein
MPPKRAAEEAVAGDAADTKKPHLSKDEQEVRSLTSRSVQLIFKGILDHFFKLINYFFCFLSSGTCR